MAVFSAKENTFEKSIYPSISVSVCQVSGCVWMSSEPWPCEAKLLVTALAEKAAYKVYKLHCFVFFCIVTYKTKIVFRLLGPGQHIGVTNALTNLVLT